MRRRIKEADLDSFVLAKAPKLESIEEIDVFFIRKKDHYSKMLFGGEFRNVINKIVRRIRVKYGKGNDTISPILKLR